MSATETVREYYEALRRGEPLYPFFREADDVVKFGIGERLVGYDAVAEGLREQSRTTDDWTVESHALQVHVEGDAGAFADRVDLGWTDTEAGVERRFETRWSGSLVRVDDAAGGGDGAPDDEWVPDDDAVWLFTGMHVSTAEATS